MKYNIPFYKKPYKALLQIMLPSLLIGIVCMGIFFQEDGISDRVANISTVLLALFGIFYGINDIIKKGKITLYLSLIYSILLIPLMAII